MNAVSRLKGIETHQLHGPWLPRLPRLNAVSRLKGIETVAHSRRMDLLLRNSRLRSLNAVSRLKGIETQQCFRDCQPFWCLNAVSRLKGIETGPDRADPLGVPSSLNAVSRLKGIETNWSPFLFGK